MLSFDGETNIPTDTISPLRLLGTVGELINPEASMWYHTVIGGLREHVGVAIGSIAKPDDIRFAEALPKTRSGKIMRRLLKEIAVGGPLKGI